MESVWKPTNVDIPPVCPRCGSSNTKFCYYNNYSLTQPRYFCKGCRRYWTKGGSLRNVPIGGGCRKSRRSGKSIRVSSSRALLHGGIESTSGNNDNPCSSNTNASNNAPIDLAAVYANFLNPNPREDMVLSNSCQLPENGFLQAIPSFEYPNFVSLGNNIDDHLVRTSCTQNVILQMDQGFSTGFLDCGPSYRDVLTENRLLGGDGSEMYCDGIDIFHQKLDDNGVIVPENNFGSNNTNHHHMENSSTSSTIILPPLPGEDLVPWPAAGLDFHVMMSSNQQVLDTTTHHHHVMTGQDLGLLNGNNVMLSPSSNLDAIFRR